jgi:hypothetical protein
MMQQPLHFIRVFSDGRPRFRTRRDGLATAQIQEDRIGPRVVRARRMSDRPECQGEGFRRPGI